MTTSQGECFDLSRCDRGVKHDILKSDLHANNCGFDMAQTTKTTDAASTVATDEQLRGRSREVAWYSKDPPTLSREIREVLERYSQIPAQLVDDHVYALREKAWEIHPFPCIGSWRFVDLVLCHQPQYAEILSRVRNGGKFLDLGCCFGQEIRRLIIDGAPGENLYGADLRQDYLDLGHALFRDRGSCKATFVAANALAPASEEWTPLSGNFSMVYTGAFFHCFDRDDQLSLAKLVARLLRPEAGSMVLGRQVGDMRPGAYAHMTNEGGIMYRHNKQSWQELWDEVGEELGVQWRVEGELRALTRGSRGFEGTMREFHFCVTRL